MARYLLGSNLNVANSPIGCPASWRLEARYEEVTIAQDRSHPTAFDEDGFVAVQGFFDADELDAIRAELDKLIDGGLANLPPEHVFYEDKSDPTTLKQIQHLDLYSPLLHQVFHQGRPQQLAESLLEAEVVPKNLQYFNKPPLCGKPTPAHQDGFYFMLTPCEAVTLWVALDSVNEENGCVHYARASHRRGMRPHQRTSTLGFSQGIQPFPLATDIETQVPVPAEPGDLLAHHALTIHWAGGNQSATRQRRALGWIYYSKEAMEDVAAHQRYQSKLASDLRRDARI